MIQEVSIKSIKKIMNQSKRYDIQVLNNHNFFANNILVHNSFCCIGYVPGLKNPDLFQNGDVFVASKGLGAQGLVFKNNDKNTANVYVRMYHSLIDTCNIVETFLSQDKPMYILGEIYGKGIQDLHYGLQEPHFRVFDIYIGKPGEGEYVNPGYMNVLCRKLNLDYVDSLHIGPFSRTEIDKLIVGKTITGNGSNILEGIVIKPLIERRHDEIGRVILKHISEAYLTRKGEITELT